HVDLFKPALEFLSESDIPAEESLDKFLGCIFPNKDKQQEEYENVDETPLQANQEENLEEDEKSGIDGLSEASVQQLEEDYVEEDAGEGAVQQLEDDYVEVDADEASVQKIEENYMEVDADDASLQKEEENDVREEDKKIEKEDV